MSELRQPEKKKRRAPKTAFKKGKSGNPGGQSKEKREFLEQLRDSEGDAKKVYAALMRLIKKGNPQAVLWAAGHIMGKPPDKVELTGKDGGPIRVATRAWVKALSTQDVEKLNELARKARGDAVTGGTGGADAGGAEAPKPP